LSRIGVLGGTFDPLHLGHLRAAEIVRDALRLDRVLFVPAATPPHKAAGLQRDARLVTESSHRLRMVELALAGERFFEASRVEVDRGGRSYTVDTMESLEAAFPGSRLFFVVGTDAFSEIHTWKNWRELLSRYSFAVHERPGASIDRAPEALPPDLRTRVTEQTDPMRRAEDEAAIVLVRRAVLDVSSTEIRASVRAGRSIRFLVPDAVEAYIRENRLYQ
jgi:nicotinate-nucleotide adenylyltransferase